MTDFIIECAADSCPEDLTVTEGDPTRCPACGTRYDETTVLSSPLPTVEAGDEGRRIGPVPEPDEPDTATEADADATMADGRLDINLNLNVDGS